MFCRSAGAASGRGVALYAISVITLKTKFKQKLRFADRKVKKTRRAGSTTANKKLLKSGLSAEDQRACVWEKRLEGHSQYDIGRALNITQARVSQLLKESYEKKRADRLELADDLVNMELERIDRMILAWYVRASKEERASEVYLKWLQQRHKILGLEITKTELSGRSGGPIQINASNIDITKLNDEQLGWLEIIITVAGPKVELPEDQLPALEHKPRGKS